MEEYLLSAKHYQIFLSLIFPVIIAAFIPNIDQNILLIKIVLLTLPSLFWIFMLGKALNICTPARYRLNEIFLTINLFFYCIVFALITLFTDYSRSFDSWVVLIPLYSIYRFLFTDYSVTFKGWAVLIPLYTTISFLYLFYFASKALTSAEQRRRTVFGEHNKEMALLLFGYLSIWYMQPRINALWEQNKDKFSDEEPAEETHE